MNKFLISVACLALGCMYVPAANPVLNETETSVSPGDKEDSTVEETVALVTRFCPEWATRVGTEKVSEVFGMLAKADNSGRALSPVDLMLYGLAESQGEELDVFINQVLPLAQYLLANRTLPEKVADDAYTVENVYTTPKDGCHFGVGDERNTYDPMGIDCEDCKARGGKLKANGSYAWGMVAHDGKVYWSTNNNYLCMPG